MKRIIYKTLVLGTSCIALTALSAHGVRAADGYYSGDVTPLMMPARPAAVVNDFPLASDMQGIETRSGATHAKGGLEGTVTLRDAVAIGISTNPEVGVVQNNRRATDEELRQARGLFLPSIDMRADTGFEHTNSPSTRNNARSGNSEELWRYQAGLTLTQLLFDGFDARYETERQEMRVLSASNRVREAAELVGLSVVEAYLEVMRQRELLMIARQNVSEHIAIMDQIQDSAQVGRSTQADVEQAKARLASARAQESDVRARLRFAEASYIRATGDAPADLTMPLVPIDALQADLDSQVDITLYQSPTIDIFQADIQVAQAEYQRSKALHYPQVDLQLNARQGDNLNGIRGRDRSASALVVMDWNLYRGGIDTANVREHINRESQAKRARAQAARGVENDVRQTWAQMISAGERARQFATQADANVEVVKSYRDQFDLNRRTLLDVLDAQNELFVSRSNTVNSEFVEMFAVYRLLALQGQLLPTLDVDYPRESNPAKL